MNKNVKLESSITHVQGKSEFLDDRPPVQGEVHVGIVTSSISHGRITHMDFKKALALQGVEAIFSASDIPHNKWGTIFQDQPILADKVIHYYGEPILLVACTDRETFREAKKLIKISYEEFPAILSIEEARAKNSFIMDARFIERGDVKSGLLNSEHQLSGVLKIKGQEHFYLESQCAIAYPKEKNDLEIHSSSQHPTEVQHIVAHCLGLSDHEIVSIVKRMGGGFGGKESQAVPFAVMAALVAHKLKRAARVVVTKDEDMLITGKRNPFEALYKVGFNSDGKINALDLELYSNSGAYADLSTSIMERAMLHSDNAYYLKDVKIKGHVCKTHMAPTTAFRGFGGPKGVAVIENIVEEMAIYLKMDALKIREINCYQGKNNTTPYGQEVTPEILPKLFKELKNKIQYEQRRSEINKFNQKEKFFVQGLSLMPVKFGISFTTRFLNQGCALVNLHLDGTFQVSTGATEMGQGVNTKIAQTVADVFNLDAHQVKIMPTSTEKNHNTSPTAASSGSDINAGAALKAALKIKRRLQLVADFMLKNPGDKRGRLAAGLGITPEILIDENKSADHIKFQDGYVFDENKNEHRLKFTEVIDEAYLNRVSLGAYEFFRYEGIHFNKVTGQGNPFFYFTNGVAASQVQIDKLTGEVKVLRTDILMDLGRPLNEGIDRGQVIGAFVQGMGWVTTENLVYNKKGALLTHSPSTYKIPSIQDTPREFNLDFLVNDLNEKNVKGSKAVGEPPLLLGISVWTAIKNALSYIDPKSAQINLPATSEEILMRIPE